jgi:hypothetical protein
VTTENKVVVLYCATSSPWRPGYWLGAPWCQTPASSSPLLTSKNQKQDKIRSISHRYKQVRTDQIKRGGLESEATSQITDFQQRNPQFRSEGLRRKKKQATSNPRSEEPSNPHRSITMGKWRRERHGWLEEKLTQDEDGGVQRHGAVAARCCGAGRAKGGGSCGAARSSNKLEGLFLLQSKTLAASRGFAARSLSQCV